MPRFVKKRPFLTSAIIFLVTLGAFLTHNAFADIRADMEGQIRKLVSVARLAQMYYVEEVDWDTAVEGAISGMLEKLDPHSVYIPPDKAQENKENFSGKYEGIGIQYDIIDGYLTVISPIAGSPSYKLGIKAGDRIVKIEGKSAYGIEREEVPDKLKGPKGSLVNVTIQRDGVKGYLDFDIERDEIPITTITASFMEDDSTGYIALSRFAAITAREVEEKLRELEKQNLKRLIFDLRGNSGGYLTEAVKVVGKFVKGHKIVVYTKGRSGEVDEEYFSDEFGRRMVRNYPLVVLVDRGSASAAEIVAGAIQDYDRGLIVGENSFGKGLVQKEFPLHDGSAVRVTTAKYYTPAGRCIQRDYKGKDPEEYYQEIPDSTWASEDSLKNRPSYQTTGGRVVFGGGGIQPDVYVSSPVYSQRPQMVGELLQKQIFFEYASQLLPQTRPFQGSMAYFRRHFKITPAMEQAFKNLIREKAPDVDMADVEADMDFIRLRLKADLARRIWENDGYYYMLLGEDNQYQHALKLFGEARKLAMLN